MVTRVMIHAGLIVYPALLLWIMTAAAQPIKREGFKADLVIVNAHVITVDEKNPYAEAVAVYRDKISQWGHPKRSVI